MNGLITYSGITTKIRAMESHFLTDDDFRELTALPDVPTVAERLMRHPGYEKPLAAVSGQKLNREHIEQRLPDAVFYDFERIYHFADASLRSFLKHYARRYEVHFIKSILTRIAVLDKDDENAIPAAVTDRKDFYDHFTCLDFTKLVEASTLDDVLAALEDTPYRDTLRRVQNQGGAGIFRYETALDLFHFSAIWKEKDELPDSSAKSLALFYGTKFDLLNIWFIYRARTNFRMDTSGIYALTIPVLYRLSKKDIMAMVEAPDGAAFADAVRNTWYGGRYPALAPDNLQYMYTEIMREIIRAEARRNPYSTAMPYYYLYWKEHEVYRLTSAIECVRYGIPPEEAFLRVTRR